MSSTEDFDDLFGEGEVHSSNTNNQHSEDKEEAKYIEYTSPSSNAKLKVKMVSHHVLWGHYLWNGARWMSDYIDGNKEIFRGRSVVELGAGAGLPSIMAGRAGASPVVCTDYPDDELIRNIQDNIDSLTGEGEGRNIYARGYLWGANVDELLKLNGGRKYDHVFLCDVIFNHSEHKKLLKSVKELLADEGTCWCVFSHYRPWYLDRDLNLLLMANRPADEENGFGMRSLMFDIRKYSSVGEGLEDSRADPDIIRMVFAHKITK